VIVNYETTWYPSHAAMWRIDQGAEGRGDIRKMVAMDGHQGPKEIGVGPEFLGWLTDPVKNGAGALFDFGCYGANLMTWMMDNQRPVAVTAITQTTKPQIYARVDDEASVLVEYPKAQGIIQAVVELAFQPQGFRSLRRARIRHCDRRRRVARAVAGRAGRSPHAGAAAARRTRFVVVSDGDRAREAEAGRAVVAARTT
jgi:predicted dehydrogenase